ncbi:hypothetical protein B0F90DRAFT_1702976 [Multifurca ochricompacta]|uniref:THH1/TOM1/TOM3 domain-containing protein n=1 Tax=Multifurca ochricompacta TaxID=376703 RepID=A0AAD4M805_9AGAM|nr:hypothetical protein B0F90DRAFT_1702976 [Multifurca ochricompacta]
MTCWLLLLATASTVLQIRWTLLAFVTQQQNVSPSVFIEENINNWTYVMLNALYVIINWSVDGTLVFRFYYIFNRTLRWLALPAFLYLSSLVTGSLALRQLATPGTTQNTNKLANWLVVYRTVSLSLSIILTSLIAGRLIFVHRGSGSVFRSPRSPFLGIAAMVVESASLETVSTLVYIIVVGISSPLQNVFLPLLGQVQVIAPMLILYRVAHGRDAVTEASFSNGTGLLPQHMTQPTLSLQIITNNLATISGSSELSASPIKSSQGLFESPRISYPPPYKYPDNDCVKGIIPPSPSIEPNYIHKSGANVKRTTWS